MPMTYDSLFDQIVSYGNRDDARFLAQVPNFISQAEERIYSECRIVGFQKTIELEVKDTMHVPPDWVQTISILYNRHDADPKTLTPLLPQSMEYCFSIFPSATMPGMDPCYYALSNDIRSETFVMAIYIFPALFDESNDTIIWTYISRPLFNRANQSTYLTQQYSRLLLYACLIEAQPFLREDERLRDYESLYQSAKGNLLQDKLARYDDKTFRRDKS